MPHNRRLNRDRLVNCEQDKAGHAAMAVITRLQDYPPDQQIVALTGCFLLMLEAYDVTVQQAMEVTKNVINDNTRRLIPEFAAVKAYLDAET